MSNNLKNIDKFHIDQKDFIEIHIDEKIVNEFSKLSGDFSSIHTNFSFANKFGFSKKIIHGSLLISFISQLVGMRLPGIYSILNKLDIKFINPCYYPNLIKIEGKIIQISKAVNSIVMEVEVYDSNNIIAKGKTYHKILEQKN